MLDLMSARGNSLDGARAAMGGRQAAAIGGDAATAHIGRAGFSDAGGLNCGQPRVSLLLLTTKTS